MPITTSTDDDIIAVPVDNVFNQFSLGSKLVGITSDGGTDLAICKVILESNFDNMGVFDLENPMLVMECLAHVLYDSFKEEVMGVEYDYGRVYTDLTRSNMQHFITWKKKSKRG